MANPIDVIRRLRDVQEGIGEFIRNGPDTGLPGYVRDKYRERCDQFANLPPWARLLGNGTAGTMDRMCRGYWEDEGKDGPISEPPFPGGQCEDSYFVFFSYNPIATNGTTIQPLINDIAIVQGPLSNFRSEGSGASQVLLITNGGGGSQTLISGTAPQGNFRNEVLTSVSLRFGGADNCGDQPPILKPGPNPPVDPGPIDGPEPTDDPRNPFGPPLIPIPPFDDPVYGPIPIVGDPEPTGPGGGGGAGGGDGLPGSPDAVGDEAGAAAGGEGGEDVDFGEPPEGSIWVGALVQAVVDSRLGNIPGTGPPQTVYPTVIGNASLIYTGARGTNERLESASTLLARATTALVLTGCRVQAQPGVNLTVRPISALTCPENPCEEQDG